jgi:hypothetical protein
MLITLSFSPSGVLTAGEFTVYKRDRTTALSAHPAKNLILFSHLEGQGHIYEFTAIAAPLIHYQFRVVSSNIPSLIVTSQFFAQYCQAERQPGPHPLRPGPGAARARASHFIWCAPSKPNSRAPKKEAHKVTDKGSNRRPSRPEPMFRIHFSPPESLRTFGSQAAEPHLLLVRTARAACLGERKHC